MTQTPAWGTAGIDDVGGPAASPWVALDHGGGPDGLPPR